MIFSKFVKKTFKKGNVTITGLRGTGKDMLMANYAIRQKKGYISNLNYGGKYIPLTFSAIDIPATPESLRSGSFSPYNYPYPDEADILISDASIFFPSYDFKELNKSIPGIATFCALSRHLGDCNIHFNCQNLERMWDKFREQSDIYIRCLNCKVLFGKLVFQRVRVYQTYDACVKSVPPCPKVRSIFSKIDRHTQELLEASYKASHGEIKTYNLLYINRSHYDTRFFKKYLAKT